MNGSVSVSGQVVGRRGFGRVLGGRTAWAVAVLAVALGAAGPLAAVPPFPTPPPIPPHVEQAFRNLGVPQAQWAAWYNEIASAVGSGVRELPKQASRVYGPIRFYGDAMAQQMGKVVCRGKGFSNNMQQIFESAANAARGMSARARLDYLRKFLTDSQTYMQALRARFDPKTIEFLNQSAQYAAEAGGAGAAGAAGGGAAGGGTGGSSWLARILARIRGMGGGGAAMQVLAFLAVAGATQATIDACLTQYEGEMQALGTAAEREGYNHLVEMLVAHLQDGTLLLPEGKTMADGLHLLRENLKAGRSPFAGFRSRLVEDRADQLGEAGLKKYVIWSNDVGWLHVGTGAAFEQEKKTPRGKEIWGGRGQEPLKPVCLAGPFDSMDEAVVAVGKGVGKAVEKRAPLAFPKVFYVGTFKGKELKLGFEIVRHKAFGPYMPGK